MKLKTFVLCSLFTACAGVALAQTKISGTGTCGKADASHVVEVGDRAGHVLVLTKDSCTWTTPMEMAGLKSKTYNGAIASDSTGGRSQDRGYVVMTMDNGDKAYIRFQGTSTNQEGGAHSGEGTWSYAGGTGKLKGLKGKGTYKSSGATADVTEDQVEGEYTLPEAGAAAKKE
jgi:hypothetical protein